MNNSCRKGTQNRLEYQENPIMSCEFKEKKIPFDMRSFWKLTDEKYFISSSNILPNDIKKHLNINENIGIFNLK